MNHRAVSVDKDQTARIDQEELRRQVTRHIALAIIIVCTPIMLLVLPGEGFRAELFWTLVVLVAAGIMGYHWSEAHPLWARVMLALGLWAGYALALFRLPYNVIPFLGGLLVLLHAAIAFWLGLVSAGVISLLIVAWGGWASPTPTALVSIWLALGCQWITSRALFTALTWAWSSQARANQLLQELRGHRGELARTVEALTEATRRLQRTGYQLQIARMRAEELREFKSTFAANISHELRTPLNLIIGFTETMYYNPEVYGQMLWPLALRRDVSHIYQASRQLLDLVNDVLDLSRIDAVQMPISREWVGLKEVITEALDTVRHLAKMDRVRMVANVPADLPALLIDRARIRQVLINLLNNAVHFTDAGQISVEARVDADECTVTVRDTGIGIPPDELERIFDAFHQVDMSLRRSTGGTGLGLGISKRFVELHGGRIWAESVPGQGSAFTFTLPRAPQDPTPLLVDSPARRTLYNVPQPALLVVDADAGVANTFARYLEGYQVLAASGAPEALELIERWAPAAVVVNQSPRCPGLGPLAQQLYRELGELVPLLVCSIPSKSWLAQEAGVCGALTKPVSRSDLFAAIAPLGAVRDILVVDDDRRFVQLVSRYLDTAGDYAPRAAYDGAEALREVRKKRPDLLLLDLAMPDMNGIELLAQLADTAPEGPIPTLIITATDYSRTVATQQGSFLGLARHQPYTASDMVKQIQELLANAP